jgi:hypothetical protein
LEKERKNSVVEYKPYVAGWLQSSVEDFLALFPQKSEGATYALITCMDSNTDPGSLFRRDASLRSALNGATTVKKGLLVPSSVLHKPGVRSKLFVGFDEIWFFPTPEIEPKPASASIVGPRRINQQTLDKLGAWMTANDCSLALGDGEGLNFIVKAQGLAKYLIAHSLLQPGPSSPLSGLWIQDEDKKLPTAKSAR